MNAAEFGHGLCVRSVDCATIAGSRMLRPMHDDS
jgi:hypothetical protein